MARVLDRENRCSIGWPRRSGPWRGDAGSLPSRLGEHRETLDHPHAHGCLARLPGRERPRAGADARKPRPAEDQYLAGDRPRAARLLRRPADDKVLHRHDQSELQPLGKSDRQAGRDLLHIRVQWRQGTGRRRCHSGFPPMHAATLHRRTRKCRRWPDLHIRLQPGRAHANCAFTSHLVRIAKAAFCSQ